MTIGAWARVGCAMAAMAGCVHGGSAASRAIEPTERTDATAEDARRAEIQLAPVDLQVALQVRGSRAGELRDGGIVHSGDRIQLTIQTKEDSHTYLAYCSTSGGLAWFPAQGSILARANTPIIAPAERASIVMDDNPGPESLYVVISQRQLSMADQELSNLIETSRAGGVTKDCERPFGDPRRRTPMRPSAPARKKAARTAPPTVGARASDAGAQDTNAAEADLPAPDVGLVRGGYIAWDDLQQVTARVDPSGIAILRYTFHHVARVP